MPLAAYLTCEFVRLQILGSFPPHCEYLLSLEFLGIRSTTANLAISAYLHRRLHSRAIIMSWISVLPEQFAYIEWWITRTFVSAPHDVPPFCEFSSLIMKKLILAALIAVPFILLIIYDFVMYAFRVTTYEIPYIGGRARNRPRPRAPTLSERPDGGPRQLGIPATAITTSAEAAAFGDDGAESVQRIDGKANPRRTTQSSVEDQSTDKQLQL